MDETICGICGRQTDRTIKGMCVDCYIGNNLPTRISDRPWSYAINLDKKLSARKREENIQKIKKLKLNEDKTSIIIGSDSIPLTVGKEKW